MKIKFIQKIIDHIRGKSNMFKPNMPRLIFWVGSKCTLKCKLCCNLVPYSKQESYNTTDILNELKFIADNVNLKTIQIQGGEPFTHRDIAKIIDFIGSNIKAKRIEIATNGTLKLNDEVIQSLKRNPHIKVRISEYNCAEKSREKLIEQLKNEGILPVTYKFYKGNNTWFSTGEVYETRSDDTETQAIYEHCADKKCHSLVNGIFYVCGKAPIIKELYEETNYKPNDEINVRELLKSKSILKKFKLRKQISNFYKNLNIYKEQCRYCIISDIQHPAAEQLTAEEIKEYHSGVNKG